MNADSPLKIQPLEKYRHACHPALSRAGLIKPLGRPQRYCVKHYSCDVLAQQIADISWLDKVLAVGPNVRGVKPGDIVNVPGAGNCYADLEDGQGPGSRLLIREGDIAGVYEPAS